MHHIGLFMSDSLEDFNFFLNTQGLYTWRKRTFYVKSFINYTGLVQTGSKFTSTYLTCMYSLAMYSRQ